MSTTASPVRPVDPRPTGETPSLPGSRPAEEVHLGLKRGRTGMTREEVEANQRGRLIDAFVQVVAEHGYLHTSINLVAEAAGVSKKTFYVHFTDLTECFLSAYEDGSRILLGRMRAAYHPEPLFRDAIRSALGILFQSLATQPAFAWLSIVETSAAGPRVHAARLEVLARIRDLLIGTDIPPVPTSIRDAIIGGVHSELYAHIVTGRTASLPELVPAMTSFVHLAFVNWEAAEQSIH